MKEYITPDRIANSILQRRTQFNNFIIVEGIHDRLFFLKFKSEKTCVEISFGWEKLLQVIEGLQKRGYSEMIGIMDKDLRNIIPEKMDFDEKVILTDDHDLNITTLEQTFQIIFENYNSGEKTEKFLSDIGKSSVKNHIYELVLPIAYLKILNKREKLHLTFKSNDSKKNNFDYTKFIDKNSFRLTSLEKLVETVINFSHSKTKEKIRPQHEIVAKLKKIITDEKYNFNDVCAGHDFGEVISIGLKKALGSVEVNSETFLKENILAYEAVDFTQTQLYRSIKNKEKGSNSFLRV